MDKWIRILIAVEIPAEAGMIEASINKRLGICKFLQVKTWEEFSAALESFQPAVIVADYQLTRFDGTAALKLARERLPQTLFFFLTGSPDETNDAEYFEAGCRGFVVKSDLDDLSFMIHNALTQRRKTEGKGLREADPLYPGHHVSDLMQNLPGMIFRCKNDRCWTMEFVSEGCSLLTGYHSEDLVDNTAVAFADLIHPEDRDRVWHAVQEALCRATRYQISYRLFTRQKKEQWVWEQGIGVWKDGTWHVEGFIWDVTEHKKAELDLREKSEKLRMIIDHTYSLVSIMNREGKYELVSPSHQSLLGYRPEDLLNRSGFDFIHPDDADNLAEILAKGIAGKIDKILGLTYRALDINGDIHYLQGNFDSIRDAGGNLKNIVFVGNDITQTVESEKALANEKEKFRTLVEEIPLGIFLIGPDGRVEYINPKFADMFGYALNDIETEADWFGKAFPNMEYRQQVMESWREDFEQAGPGMTFPRKYRVTCKDGSEKIVLFVSIVLASKEQLVVCQDITRQDALEAQLMHSQKMESIGRLASGVAHDFNNLLTTIIGNADCALMDFEEQDPRREIILEIKEAADRAAGLTRQLLAFSRKQPSRPEIVDLNAKISEIRKMLERLIGEDIELELFLAEELAAVKIDPGQTEQIIMNLAVNARDAMPTGGKLAIETATVDLSKNDPLSPVELAPGNYVLINITDTGTGMSPEIQSRVFEPFFTTKGKGKGTGLGLSTVYGIVKQNNGNIQIYSELGKGTTIKIFLPAYAGQTLTGDGKHSGTIGLCGNETILLVEDEERVRKIIEIMLSRFGYSVLAAGNGQEAQLLFRTHHLPIKLLLSDMVMPGINGLDLARTLLSDQPDLKVLLMSGYTDSALYEEVREQGIPFIHKPFTSTTMARTIRALLDS